MKKLMIAAAIVCAAAMSHAAALNWVINTAKTSDGTTAAAGNAIMLFVSSYSGAVELDTTTVGAVTSLLKEGKVSDAEALSNGISKNLTSSANITGATGLTGFSKDETISVFAVLFNNADAEKADKFVVLSTAADSYSWANNTSPAIALFGSGGNVSAQTAKDNWQSIPEPTSGLLLLLGVAGLALKRRRA